MGSDSSMHLNPGVCVSILLFTHISIVKVPVDFMFHVCAGQCVPGWLYTSVRSPLRRVPCWSNTAPMKMENTAFPLVYMVNKTQQRKTDIYPWSYAVRKYELLSLCHPLCSLQCIMLCTWRSSQLRNWSRRWRVCAAFPWERSIRCTDRVLQAYTSCSVTRYTHTDSSSP